MAATLLKFSTLILCLTAVAVAAPAPRERVERNQKQVEDTVDLRAVPAAQPGLSGNVTCKNPTAYFGFSGCPGFVCPYGITDSWNAGAWGSGGFGTGMITCGTPPGVDNCPAWCDNWCHGLKGHSSTYLDTSNSAVLDAQAGNSCMVCTPAQCAAQGGTGVPHFPAVAGGVTMCQGSSGQRLCDMVMPFPAGYQSWCDYEYNTFPDFNNEICLACPNQAGGTPGCPAPNIER